MNVVKTVVKALFVLSASAVIGYANYRWQGGPPLMELCRKMEIEKALERAKTINNKKEEFIKTEGTVK